MFVLGKGVWVAKAIVGGELFVSPGNLNENENEKTDVQV